MSNEATNQFGANDWLVDELYAQYLENKDSVDPAWWEFFADYSPADYSPVAVPAAPVAAPAPAVATPVAPAVPSRETPTPAPAAPAAAPIAGAEKLKGTSARVVANMEASLEVPTATSVRAVPAKLMVDNRIVINNHLARARGGKISFTHIIGFALVRALKDMPDMNVAYTTIDDKPAIIRHEHVGMGLAIDLAKDDGSRQLLVPCIKSADTMDFAAFCATY